VSLLHGRTQHMHYDFWISCHVLTIITTTLTVLWEFSYSTVFSAVSEATFGNLDSLFRTTEPKW